MDQHQDPDRIANDFIDKPVIPVRCQFAGAENLAFMATHRKVDQSGCGIAEKAISRAAASGLRAARYSQSPRDPAWLPPSTGHSRMVDDLGTTGGKFRLDHLIRAPPPCTNGFPGGFDLAMEEGAMVLPILLTLDKFPHQFADDL